MNGKRFVALIAKDAGSRSAWERANAEKLTDMPGFERLVAGNRLTLVTEIGAALRIDDQGFVVGTLFERTPHRLGARVRQHVYGCIVGDHSRAAAVVPDNNARCQRGDGWIDRRGCRGNGIDHQSLLGLYLGPDRKAQTAYSDRL